VLLWQRKKLQKRKPLEEVQVRELNSLFINRKRKRLRRKVLAEDKMALKKKAAPKTVFIPDLSVIKLPDLSQIAEQIDRINRFSELVISKNVMEKLSSLTIPNIDLTAITKSIANIEKFEKSLLKKKIVYSKEKTVIPHIFLDTNILFAVIETNSADEVSIMEKIKSEKWKCSTSYISIMECLDLLQDATYFKTGILVKKKSFKQLLKSRDQKELSEDDKNSLAQEVDDKFFKRYPDVKVASLVDTATWEKGLAIKQETTIFSQDALILLSALEGGCDILLTLDGILIKKGTKYLKDKGKHNKLRICRPNELITNLINMDWKVE